MKTFNGLLFILFLCFVSCDDKTISEFKCDVNESKKIDLLNVVNQSFIPISRIKENTHDFYIPKFVEEVLLFEKFKCFESLQHQRFVDNMDVQFDMEEY